MFHLGQGVQVDAKGQAGLKQLLLILIAKPIKDTRRVVKAPQVVGHWHRRRLGVGSWGVVSGHNWL